MIVGELSFYVLIGAIATVATIVYALWARQYSGPARKLVLVAPYVTGMLAIGYFGMSAEILRLHSPGGRPVPATRFIVYMFSYSFVIGYVGLLANAERRYILSGMGLLTLFAIAGLINWLTAPPIEIVGKLLFLSSLLGQLYLLFGPYTRASRDVSGSRQLAFGKLRNLMALLLLMYLLVGLTSRQGLGLLGTFTGVYMGAYMDVLGHLGFAGILLRSDTAVEHLANDRSSLFAVVSRGDSSSTADAPAGD